VSAVAELERELERWRAADLSPRLWLRDDDAVEPSPSLDRLLDLARRHEAPLLLAVIPANATEALARRLHGEPLAVPCVHGWAHARHTPAPAKAMELGGDRPTRVVLDELVRGRERLRALFGARLSGILVPPWNRIAPDIAERVHECGFTALSTFDWRSTGTTLPEINTHVDIVDWHGGRGGRDLDWALAECTRRLAQARERGGEPVGILSHHLVHDEQAWATLDGLMGALKARGCGFHRADALVGAPPQ
jgi:hypothetical protein